MGNKQETGHGQRQMPSRVKLSAQVALALLAIPGVGLAIEACGSGDSSPSGNGQKTETPSPMPSATAIVESPTPTAISTAKPPEPTSTATEIITPTPTEAAASVPCEILPQEYCSQADVVEFTYQERTYTYVGLRLPPDIPLRSPMDGQVAKAEIAQPSPYKGFLATVMDPDNPVSGSFGFVGDLKFPNMLSINIKKGDIIGSTQDTGIENFGNYNLLVGASNIDSLRNLFPEAFKKQVKVKR